MNTVEEVVAAGVQAQADIDKHLTKAYLASLRLAEITAKGVEFGMVPKAIAAKTIIAESREIPGLIAHAAAMAASLHAKQTKICQDAGVDTPTPSSVGGISILGGGDR
jgi:PIN domain nuclease of toxin-antitoxin system